jgi:hypothetical protein
LFVAIVWSIAGAFQLLFYGGPWLVDRAIRSGWIADSLVTPRPVQATDCSAAVREIPQPGPDAAPPARTRVAAYQLGFNLGVAAGGRNAGTAGTAALEQMERARAQLASELGIPTPELPPVRRLADALHEFEVHITADRQCIGARLAKRYSDRHDALYRFGAFAGHSVMYRTLAPEVGAVFVPDLREFGKAAGLPQEAWRPLIDVASGVSGAQAQAQALAAAQRIEGFLSAEPETRTAPVQH